jgi:hypothetical protein
VGALDRLSEAAATSRKWNTATAIASGPEAERHVIAR